MVRIKVKGANGRKGSAVQTVEEHPCVWRVLRAFRSYASLLIRNIPSIVIIFLLIAGFVIYNVTYGTFYAADAAVVPAHRPGPGAVGGAGGASCPGRGGCCWTRSAALATRHLCNHPRRTQRDEQQGTKTTALEELSMFRSEIAKPRN